MPKYTVNFCREIRQYKEVVISAKNEDTAWETAEAMVDDGLCSEGWGDEDETIEIDDVYKD